MTGSSDRGLRWFLRLSDNRLVARVGNQIVARDRAADAAPSPLSVGVAHASNTNRSL